MLKKLFSFFFCVVIAVFAVSCGGTSDNSTSQTLKITSALASSGEDLPPDLQDIHKKYEYKTFEKLCEEVDYIVVANYVDSVNYSDEYSKFVYNVKESLRGDLSGNIDIYTKNLYKRPYVYTYVEVDGEKHYFTGEDVYLLQMTESSDMLENMEFVMLLKLEELDGFEEPQYTWYCSTVVNLTDLSKSKIYSIPLEGHIGIDISTATRESVLEYINSLVAKTSEN